MNVAVIRSHEVFAVVDGEVRESFLAKPAICGPLMGHDHRVFVDILLDERQQGFCRTVLK